jgi:hypothetical protein
VTRGMGTGLGVPSMQRLSRSVQGRGSPAKWGAAATSTLGEGGSCLPDESAWGCWPRRPNAAQRMTGETMAGQGCSTDGTTGWRGTWASGPAQPNPSHGERAARKQAVEREERRNELTSAAHLGDGGTWLWWRFGESEGEIVARKWATGGRNCACGRLFSLKFRTGVTKKKHHGRPDAWDRLKRRRRALHALGVDACALGHQAATGAELGQGRALGRGASGAGRTGAEDAAHSWAGGLARALGRQGWAAAWSGAGTGERGSWAAARAGPRGRRLAWANGGKRGGRRGRLGRSTWARGGEST